MNEATVVLGRHLQSLEAAFPEFIRMNGLAVVSTRDLAKALHGWAVRCGKDSKVSLRFDAVNFDSIATVKATEVARSFKGRFYNWFRPSLVGRFEGAEIGATFLMLDGNLRATVVVS